MSYMMDVMIHLAYVVEQRTPSLLCLNKKYRRISPPEQIILHNAFNEGFQLFWSTETAILNPMNHPQGEANEAGRWEEHRDLRDRIGKTMASGPRGSHSTVRNFGFGLPISHNGRQVVELPSLATSDTSSSEGSHEAWISNSFDSSSSPGSSMSELSRLPPLPAPSLSQTIEIFPGVNVPLRGADETWKAIQNDYYMPAECICCKSTIFCIQNADYVLCPDCRVVSRMEGPSSSGIGGVGLGFKYVDLARWQEALLRDQLCRRPYV
jgi:hypothetical protein